MEGEASTDPRLGWTVPWRWVPRVEIDRKIGIAFADFYDALLDSYLRPDDDRSGQVEAAFQKLPRPLRPLVRKALAAIEQEAHINQALVEAHRGNEAIFLLGDQLREKPEAAAKILPRAANETTFVELAPGLYLLVMQDRLFQLFRDHEVILKGGGAFANVELGRERPKFIVVPSDELGERAERHELRHVLWSFLRQADFVRPTTEEGTMARGFESFRDEFMAYVLGEARLPKWVKYLVYEDDLELEKTGDSLRLLSSAAIDFSYKKADPRALAHAAVVSRSFKEFSNQIVRMMPIQQDLDANGLRGLLSMCSETMPGGEKAVVVLRQLVDSRGLTASTAVRVDALTLHGFRGSYRYLREKVETAGENLAALFGQDSDFVVQQAIKNSLRQSCPEEVVNMVLGAPFEITSDLHLTDYPRTVIGSIGIWNITDRASWEFFRRLVNVNPEYRETFATDSTHLARVVRDDYRHDQGFKRPWANQKEITRGAEYRGALVKTLGWAKDFDEARKAAQFESDFPTVALSVG